MHNAIVMRAQSLIHFILYRYMSRIQFDFSLSLCQSRSLHVSLYLCLILSDVGLFFEHANIKEFLNY